MKFKFKEGMITALPNGEFVFTSVLPSEYNENIEKLNKIVQSENLKVLDVGLHKDKRSLNANAYLWTLIHQMAQKLGRTDEEQYIHMLRDYGQKEYYGSVEGAEPYLKKVYKVVEPIGDCMLNSTKGVTFRVIRGSSTYDSKEFSVLLDGVIQECKNLGIETMTPNEVARLIKEMEAKNEYKL